MQYPCVTIEAKGEACSSAQMAGDDNFILQAAVNGAAVGNFHQQCPLFVIQFTVQGYVPAQTINLAAFLLARLTIIRMYAVMFGCRALR